MNLDDAKENIQPLAGGRNIRRLETALSAESHEAAHEQLLAERRACEEAIRTYVGDDPLAPWYEYVLWVEQSCPRSGKESALDEVIQKCLVAFDNDERYRQDARMVKLYIKYIDGQPNPTEHFHTLYSSGIGTRCADLYIGWAYYHDLADAFDRAEEVFRRGRDAHAEPRDQLEQAHRQFGFSMSQRMLHKETYRQEFISTMEERRSALTSLRSHRAIGGGGRGAAATGSSHQVGSVRTGAAAVKSLAPGRVEMFKVPGAAASTTSNAKVAVYSDAAAVRPAATPEAGASATSVVQAIIDSSRRQENLREAGPWSKAGAGKRPLFDSSKPSSVPQFPILVDVDMDMDSTQAPIDVGGVDADLAIRLFSGHVRHNLAQRPFPVAEFVEEDVAANAFPAYDKCMLYPQTTKSYSIEELAAYRWFVRRGIRNAFVEAHESVWDVDCCAGVREYPLFQRRNETKTEPEWRLERYVEVESVNAGLAKIMLPMDGIYPAEREERSMEELLRDRWLKGELPNAPEDEVDVDDVGADETMIGNAMDVTMAVKGRQSIYGGAVRKSIVPGGRRSIRPPSSTLDEKRHTMMAACPSIDEVEDIVEKEAPTPKVATPATVATPAATVATPATVAGEQQQMPMVPSIFQKTKATAAVDPLPEFALPETAPKPHVLFDLPAEGPSMPTIPTPIRKSVVPTTPTPALFDPLPALPAFENPKLPSKPRVMFDMAAAGPSMPRITGPIRKSVVPTQKSRAPTSSSTEAVVAELPSVDEVGASAPDKVEHTDIIDQASEPADVSDTAIGVPVPTPAPAPVPFAIFEDTIVEPQRPAPSAASETDVFKQPLAPSEFLLTRRPLVARSRSPGHDDPETDAGEQTAYMPNETCSTQQFNFFIKAQSISTPKRLGAPRDPIELELSPTLEAAAKAPTPIVSVSSEQSPEYALATATTASTTGVTDVISPAIATRQLSTIMETTEGTPMNSTSSDRESDSGSHRNMAASTAGTSMLPTKRTQPPSLPLDAVPTPLLYGVCLASDAPADIASQYPIQVYEDRTETVPLFNLLRPPTTTTMTDISLLPPPPPPSDMTLPALAAIEIYRDPTEQMPMMPAAMLAGPQLLPANVLAERLPMHEQPDVSLMSVAALPPPATPRQPLLADESLAALAGNITFAPPSANAIGGVALEPQCAAQPNTSNPPPANILIVDDDDDMEMFLQSPKSKSSQPFVLTAVPASVPTALRPFALASAVQPPPNKPAVPSLSDVSDFLIEPYSPTASPTPPQRSPKSKSSQPFGLAAAPAPAPTALRPFALASAVQPPPNKPAVPSLSDVSDFLVEPYSPIASPTPPQRSPKSKSSQPVGLAAVPAPAPTALRHFALATTVQPPPNKPAVPSLSDVSDFLNEPYSPSAAPTPPQRLPQPPSSRPQFQHQSIHIKSEPIDAFASAAASVAASVASVAAANDFSFVLDAVDMLDEPTSGVHGAASKRPMPSRHAAVPLLPMHHHLLPAAPSKYEPEESIYVPRMVVQRRSVNTLADEATDDDDAAGGPANAEFVQPCVDMDATRQVIQTHLIDDNADPFDERVQQAFLEQCDFYDYLGNLPACQMQQNVRLLHVNRVVDIAGDQFHVQRLLGNGQFGQVFAAKSSRTGVTMALKQQRPASLWEYYICLEVESRIDVPHMMRAYMRIECALIGNNAGILVSECSRYGSLLAVCNKVKTVTGKNMAETVVMMLSMQLLAAVDHLHGCKIIHADIKPDNILLMRRLTNDTDEMCLQLIDFGQAIDLQLYPDGQTFRSQLSTKNFVCTEMLDGRPWLQQTDLFCTASTIHTMLFGTYMNVRKHGVLGYQITTSVPRYFHKWLWESLFQTLINVKDCRMMPNLQTLRVMLLTEVRGAREQATREAIETFNRVIEE